MFLAMSYVSVIKTAISAFNHINFFSRLSKALGKRSANGLCTDGISLPEVSTLSILGENFIF